MLWNLSWVWTDVWNTGTQLVLVMILAFSSLKFYTLLYVCALWQINVVVSDIFASFLTQPTELSISITFKVTSVGPLSLALKRDSGWLCKKIWLHSSITVLLFYFGYYLLKAKAMLGVFNLDQQLKIWIFFI